MINVSRVAIKPILPDMKLNRKRKRMCLYRVFKFISLIFALQSGLALSQIATNTQVSLNSDASTIAIGYVDHLNNEVVDIAAFNELPRLRSTRLALGQHQTYTISFGFDPKTLLVTTRSKNGSALLRIDISNKNSPIIRKLYEHSSTLRFPVEAEANKFVFLEQIEESTGRSRWQILDSQRKYSSSAGSFRSAATPSVVGGGVFYLSRLLPRK